MIRKLSFNENLTSSNENKQSKAIFESRKASHEKVNLILGKKSPNVSNAPNHLKLASTKNVMKVSETGFHSHKPSAIFQSSETNFHRSLAANISPVKELGKSKKLIYKVESNRDPLHEFSSKKKSHERISSQIKGIDTDFLKKDLKNFTSSTKNLVKSKPRHQKSYSNTLALNLVSHRSSDKNDILGCSG